MNTFSVQKVSSRKQFNQFLNCPSYIYKSERHWTPNLRIQDKETLSPTKNKLLIDVKYQLWILLDSEQVIGRIAAFSDPNRADYGYFGFFDCKNDSNASAKLFNCLEAWFLTEKITTIEGPCNISQHLSWGLLVDGFSTPTSFMMGYHPEYISKLILSQGFAPLKDMHAYSFDVVKPLDPVFKKISTRNQHRFNIRSIEFDNLREESEKIWTIYNRAWKENFEFTPISLAAFVDIANDLAKISEEKLIFLIETESKQAVGCLVLLPDINPIVKKIRGKLLPFGWVELLRRKKSMTSLRALLFGLDPSFQNLGLTAHIAFKARAEALKLGYISCEFSWVLEDNRQMKSVISKLGAERSKTFRLYVKPLESA